MYPTKHCSRRNMETIRDIMEQASMLSELVADAILKKTAPVKDDISERQAMSAYGSKWLKRMKEDGLAKSHRIGGRVLYSRHQLDCLRVAERKIARLLIKK